MHAQRPGILVESDVSRAGGLVHAKGQADPPVLAYHRGGQMHAKKLAGLAVAKDMSGDASPAHPGLD
jgi:hypothetical protein